MSHATLTPKSRSSLRGATLPKWFLWAVAAGSIAAGLGISAAAGLNSSIQWALIAAVLFVLGTYAISARVEGGRQAKDRVATSMVWVAFIVAVIPLASLVWATVKRGVKVLDGYFLTHSMGVVADAEVGGGIYHAILGTLEQVGIATLISVPVGVLTAIYLVEYGSGKLAKAVTFFVDVMTGIPSIVAGLFILSTWILMLDMGPSGFAGSLALSILMIPVVVRSTEEMLKLVPNELREASLALGVPKWRTIPERWSCRRRSAASPPASCWRSPASPVRRPPCCCWSGERTSSTRTRSRTRRNRCRCTSICSSPTAAATARPTTVPGRRP